MMSVMVVCLANNHHSLFCKTRQNSKATDAAQTQKTKIMRGGEEK